MEINDCDISTVNPLPTFGDKKDDKIIFKFTRRETRNEFYGTRKTVASRKVSILESFKDHTLLREKRSSSRNRLLLFGKSYLGL